MMPDPTYENLSEAEKDSLYLSLLAQGLRHRLREAAIQLHNAGIEPIGDMKDLDSLSDEEYEKMINTVFGYYVFSGEVLRDVIGGVAYEAADKLSCRIIKSEDGRYVIDPSTPLRIVT